MFEYYPKKSKFEILHRNICLLKNRFSGKVSELPIAGVRLQDIHVAAGGLSSSSMADSMTSLSSGEEDEEGEWGGGGGKGAGSRQPSLLHRTGSLRHSQTSILSSTNGDMSLVSQTAGLHQPISYQEVRKKKNEKIRQAGALGNVSRYCIQL